MEQYNARFAKAPFEDRDVHRTLVVGPDDLDDAFAWKEERTASVNLTLQLTRCCLYTPTGEDIDSVIDVRAVFQQRPVLHLDARRSCD